MVTVQLYKREQVTLLQYLGHFYLVRLEYQANVK